MSRDVTVFGVGVFKEVIEMSSYGWALIQSDWRLSKKRKCGHTDTRDAHRGPRGEDTGRRRCPHTKERPQEEAACPHPDLGFQPPGCEAMFLSFECQPVKG